MSAADPAVAPEFDVVAIAASAGGITALGALLERLPADFPVPVVIVQHRAANPPSMLDRVLARRAALRVKHVREGELAEPGTVYLADPRFHLTIGADRRFRFADGRRIRHVLSSANPLFESLASVYGGRTIAVVLTGTGRDATDGVQAVKAAGGTVIAQDALTSEQFGMPGSAIATGAVDRILPLAEIAPMLVRLVSGRGHEN